MNRKELATTSPLKGLRTGRCVPTGTPSAAQAPWPRGPDTEGQKPAFRGDTHDVMCYGKKVTNSIYCLFVKSSTFASKQASLCCLSWSCLCVILSPNLISSKPQKLSQKLKIFFQFGNATSCLYCRTNQSCGLKKPVEKEKRKGERDNGIQGSRPQASLLSVTPCSHHAGQSHAGADCPVTRFTSTQVPVPSEKVRLLQWKEI